jgi:hypothetical protein
MSEYDLIEQLLNENNSDCHYKIPTPGTSQSKKLLVVNAMPDCGTEMAAIDAVDQSDSFDLESAVIDLEQAVDDGMLDFLSESVDSDSDTDEQIRQVMDDLLLNAMTSDEEESDSDNEPAVYDNVDAGICTEGNNGNKEEESPKRIQTEWKHDDEQSIIFEIQKPVLHTATTENQTVGQLEQLVKDIERMNLNSSQNCCAVDKIESAVDGDDGDIENRAVDRSDAELTSAVHVSEERDRLGSKSVSVFNVNADRCHASVDNFIKIDSDAISDDNSSTCRRINKVKSLPVIGLRFNCEIENCSTPEDGSKTLSLLADPQEAVTSQHKDAKEPVSAMNRTVTLTLRAEINDEQQNKVEEELPVNLNLWAEPERESVKLNSQVEHALESDSAAEIIKLDRGPRRSPFPSSRDAKQMCWQEGMYSSVCRHKDGSEFSKYERHLSHEYLYILIRQNSVQSSGYRPWLCEPLLVSERSL